MKKMFVKAVKLIDKGLTMLVGADITVYYKNGVGYTVEEKLKVCGKTVEVNTYNVKDIAITR